MNKNKEKTTELRQLQLTQLEILQYVKEICETNNIIYYLASGTLLGAVRHKGFIPWDDDVDVIMPYEDYKKFLKITSEKNDNRFFMQNSLTDENFYRAYARIRMNNTTMMQRHHTKYYVHQGIWLDIFPLVEIGNSLEIKLKKHVIRLSNYIQMENYIRANYEEFESMLGKIGLKCLFLFYKIPLKYRKKFHTHILDCVYRAKGKRNLTEVWGGITRTFPKEVFEGSEVQLEFEGEEYPVPPKYEQYLRIMYGDYMQLPPEDERKGHGNLLIDFENDYKKYLE